MFYIGGFYDNRRDEKNKDERGYTYTYLSKLSGINSIQIEAILCGEETNVDYETMLALEKTFEDPDVVSESTPYIVDRQGSYTVEDYYALPDDLRVELIDSYFFEMLAPNTMHQEIVVEVTCQIKEFIKKNKGKCKVYASPVDVRLDCDNKTMVQPDIFVLCDIDKRRKQEIMGAPDFVVEVISPSTRNKDYTMKVHKYLNAGVKEYWIIDPYKKILSKFALEDETKTMICGLGESVSVEIYDGKLEIEFGEIIQIIDEFENLE